MFKCEKCKNDLTNDFVIITNEAANTAGLYCYDCYHKLLKDLKDEFIYKFGEEGGESNEED